MSESTTNPTATPAAGTPGAGEPIPQWKKELLQRRKNLAKTIGTAATQVHDSASTVAAALTTTPTTPRAGSGTSGSPFGSSGGASYKGNTSLIIIICQRQQQQGFDDGFLFHFPCFHFGFLCLCCIYLCCSTSQRGYRLMFRFSFCGMITFHKTFFFLWEGVHSMPNWVMMRGTD